MKFGPPTWYGVSRHVQVVYRCATAADPCQPVAGLAPDQRHHLAVRHESQGCLVWPAGHGQRRHSIEDLAVRGRNERQRPLRSVTRQGPVGHAIGTAVVPGHAPQPIAFLEDALESTPPDAVLRERHARLAAKVALPLVHRTAGNNHQPAVGRRRQLGIAEIDARFTNERRRGPRLSVGRHEDADASVATHVLVSLAKRAIPPIAPANQIGERVVRSSVPDACHADDRGRRRRLRGVPDCECC